MASTLAKLKRCHQMPMPIPWGDHLDLARCVALIGEDDLREATTAMGRCLFHLQRDLLLETWPCRPPLDADPKVSAGPDRETLDLP